ncbi:MAG: maiA [Rhizobium sp.]|nr:maiA [Rhizobium sp.]
MSEIVLYDYWRSSASYRVRVALETIGLDYTTIPIHLLETEHKSQAYLAINPQGLVPALGIDGRLMTQSLAIIEYLAERHPDAGILPTDAVGRQRVRALSHAIAIDIHPVCNLHVVKHVVELTGDSAARAEWMKTFIGAGLAAFERMLGDRDTGRFCHGDTQTMADLCLVPQVYNAERWEVDISACQRVLRIAKECRELPAFKAAHPDVAKLS